MPHDAGNLADGNAGRGHAFESPWRAEQLAKLQPGQRYTLYDGEDGVLTDVDGTRTYHQVKSGRTSGSAAVMKGCLEDARRRLTERVVDRFVIATEQILEAKALALLKAAQQTEWGRGRLAHERRASADDAWERAAQVVRRRVTAGAPRIDEHFSYYEADRLTGALAKLERRLAGAGASGDKPSVDGGAILEVADFDAVRQAVLARALKSLRPLAEWQERAKAVHGHSSYSWHEAIAASWAIDSVGEREAITLARQALARGRPHVVVIAGRSGTGKSWALARVGEELRDTAAVYVLEDTDQGAPDLQDVARVLRRPVVVLVDDLRREDADRVIAQAMCGSEPIVVVAAAGLVRYGTKADMSLPRDVGELLSLLDTAVSVVTLSDAIAPDDAKALVAAAGHGSVTSQLRRRVAGATLRVAATRLGLAKPTVHPVALQRLWRDPSLQDLVFALLVVSATGVRVPQSLLRTLGAPTSLPTELDHVLVSRPLPEGGRLRWLEEQASAAALATIHEELDGDFAERCDDVVARLITAAQATDPRHRTFIRQLLRAVAPTQRAVLAAHLDELLAFAAREDTSDLVYTWLPIVTLACGSEKAAAEKVAEHIAPELTQPRSPADILLLARLSSAEQAELAVLRAVPAGAWDAEPFVDAFRLADVLPAAAARRVHEEILRVLSTSAVAVEDLLDVREIRAAVVAAVERSGSRGLRLRTFDRVEDLLRTNPARSHALTGDFLRLAERCVMQRRSRLALSLVSDALGPHPERHLVSAKAELDELVGQEAKEDVIARALATTLAAARALAVDPATRNAAAKVWEAHCRMARRWAREDVANHREALAFAWSLTKRPAQPLLAHALALTAARGLADRRTGMLTKGQVRALLHFLRGHGTTPQEGQLFIELIVATIATGPTFLRGRAATLLRTIGTGPRADLEHLAREYLERLMAWSDWAPPAPVDQPRIPRVLLELNRDSDESLRFAYVVRSRFAHDYGRVPLRVLSPLAAGSPLVRQVFFSEMFRRGDQRTLALLLGSSRTGEDDPRPERLAQVIAYEAKFGDVEKARSATVALQRSVIERGRGANPSSSHRALVALSERLGGPARHLLEMAARLNLRFDLDRDRWEQDEAA